MRTTKPSQLTDWTSNAGEFRTLRACDATTQIPKNPSLLCDRASSRRCASPVKLLPQTNGRFQETFILTSLLQHLQQHERTTNAEKVIKIPTLVQTDCYSLCRRPPNFSATKTGSWRFSASARRYSFVKEVISTASIEARRRSLANTKRYLGSACHAAIRSISRKQYEINYDVHRSAIDAAFGR